MTSRHTSALRPDATLEARMVAAHADGRDTAKAGEPRVNPWAGEGPTAVERVLARMWGRGYSAGNPVQLGR